MMRVVIAGGSGLLGRALSEKLVADEINVTILSRTPEEKGSRSGVARCELWNTEECESWQAVIEGADAVINLAGENLAGAGFLPTRWTPTRKNLLRESRLESGRVLAEAVSNISSKPKVFIQSSAVGYYGFRGDEEVTEEDSAGDDYLAKLCVDWEKSTQSVEELGVRRLILRTGLVLTAKGGSLPRLITQYRLFAGGAFGGGRQYWPWIHIEDVVGGIRHLLEEEDARGVYNLTSPTPVTNKQFSKELGRALNRPSFWPIPAFAVKTLLGEVSVVVLEGQRAIPARLSASGYKFKFQELGPALEDILTRNG